MAVSYYNAHLGRKQSSVIIPKYDLQKGMIVQANYKNQEGKLKPYMFVVLNREFRGKVHLLSLNEMTVIQLNNMARRVGVRVIPKFKKRGLDFEKIIMTESSNRFYNSKIASNMDLWYNNSYRTFFLKNIRLIQLIDYKWDQDIEEKLLNG